jgi:putative nucleotidyltransferase with HDIG domain
MTPVGSSTRAQLKAEVRPFRPVAVELLRMVGDPTVSFGKVAGLVQTDPILSMELLKIANSPLFPVRFEIVSVMQAIAFIGSDMVSALVATTCLKSMINGHPAPALLACWRHGLATALVCQQLAEAMGIPESNAYTAGLLHDIGQLAFLTVFPDYGKALAAAAKREIQPPEVERELFGMDHAEAGRWLLGQWNCPLELQNVAAKHRNPPEPPVQDAALIRLVHGGSALADLIGMAVVESAKCEELSQIAASLPKADGQLAAESFPKLAEGIVIKINAVEQSLGLG